MKKLKLISVLLIAIVALSATVDLNDLPNYANQSIPNYIVKDNTPPNNAITDVGATLGRILFYDKKLSVNNTIACASCHHQQLAFGDTAAASVGVNGTTGRHGMRLVNARFSDERKFFWDERAATLEQQTTMPIQDHAEMGYSGQNGDPDINDLITKLNNTWYYPSLFTAVFGDATITEQRMQLAIAQFVRSIQSFDSKYDAGRAQVNNDGQPFPNFSNQENMGKQLFLGAPQFDANGVRVAGGAGCAGCHVPPEFDITPNSGNNGVIGSFAGGTDLTNTRSPSLRDVVDANGAPNAGFMHNAGQNGFNTLMDVINHYDSIPTDNVNLDAKLRPGGNLARLRLTQQEKGRLAAFIRTLTGSAIYSDARWSDPFTNDSLTLITPTGLNELVKHAAIKVYPTHATSYVHIDVPQAMQGTMMRVVSISGSVVYTGKVVNRLDVANYASGMYVIVFENKQTERFIKQ